MTNTSPELHLTSRYFSATSFSAVRREYANNPGPARELDVSIPRLEDVDSHEHRCLLRNPSFVNFYQTFLTAYGELYLEKPILIQERVASDPWKVLVAVTLLNKTAGKHAVPIFFQILGSWPTPLAMSNAPAEELQEMIQCLGLGKIRSQRLIKLSKMYIQDPPVLELLRKSRCTVAVCIPSHSADDTSSVVTKRKYPPTAASHLPGTGPYALDSYRIFCVPGDEWKLIMPSDKELIKYLKWKWAIDELRCWQPHSGCGGYVDLCYMQELTHALREEHLGMT